MTSFHMICDLGLPQSKFLGTPMNWRSPEKLFWRPFSFWRTLAPVSLASRGSVLGKIVLGLGFFLCPWPRALCPRLHLCLILKNKNIARLQHQVNEELTFIDELMKYNRLSLNYTKTTYFVCAPKCLSSSLKNFTMKIGKHTIPSVESIKYLGVMIDKHTRIWQPTVLICPELALYRQLTALQMSF